MATSESFISLRDVRKVYRTRGEEFEAIQSISMEVNAGELVSIVGPSGCGKSTLLRILAGLHPHDGGEVRIGSAEESFNPSRDVGMVFQQPLLLKWRRILENVLLPAEILGLPMKQSRERARELLSMVGLVGFETSYPYENFLRRRRKIIIVVAVHAAFIAFWWLAVVLGDVPDFILPTGLVHRCGHRTRRSNPIPLPRPWRSA